MSLETSLAHIDNYYKHSEMMVQLMAAEAKR
jgi:hypothetical protein